MSKKRKKRGVVILISVLVIACTVLYFILYQLGKDDTKVVDEIKKFGYTLDDRDTELMKTVFGELKDELNKSDVNNKKYAELLSKLFIIDLYTIDNKKNKYDVGGTEYIYPEHVSNYKLKVEDTLYRYLEEDSSRKSTMPEVSKIDLSDVFEIEYTYKEQVYKAYRVVLNWEYKKDLGYDKQATVIVVNIEDKLYIAEYAPEVSE